MPPKSKRNAVNQHDKRHENGLAAPGKRIPKQKSAQNLNAAGNGKAASTPPLPPSDVAQHMTLPPATPNGSAHANTPDVNMVNGSVATKLHERRDRSMSDLSLDARPEAYSFDGAAGPFDSARPSSPCRYHDGTTATSPPSASKGNLLSLATTILSSCPLRDVIAILIILLQLSSSSLTILHFLFATLTFVPAGTSTSFNFPTLTDMFQGSGGSPSLGLIIFVDMFILVIWLLLWVPLQNFTLDLAQAVIAISLGGAAAGKDSTTNSLVLCFALILASHFAKCGFLREPLVEFVNETLAKGGFEPFPALEEAAVPRSDCYSQHGWVRTLLGVHIVAQGLLRMIRRTLSKREQQHSLAASKKVDPEAGAGLQVPRRFSGGMDTNPDPASGSSTDGRPPGLPPAAREKDKALIGKMKRKQATFVRGQQPLWAAIASTKVIVSKEVEQSHAAVAADESNARELNHIGNPNVGSEEDHVWISVVGATEVAFGARLFQKSNARKLEDGSEVGSTGVDKSKPFYVRLNGAVWSSTRIREISTNGCVDDGAIVMYKGEIHGLTAFSNYHVEFVRVADEEVISKASLISRAGVSPDASSTASPAVHPTLRPASPTTTLKKSIAAAEQQLQDIRNRLKKNKKDHKTTSTSLKKEVEALNGRLSGSGNTDDRQRQRILQLERDIKQAKETCVEVEEEIQALGDIPEEDHDIHSSQNKAWRREKNQRASTLDELERIKTEAGRNGTQAQSDITAASQKRERLLARQAKLQEQHDRLVAAKAEGKTAHERKIAQRAALLQHRADVELQYKNAIELWEQEAISTSARRIQLEQQAQYYESLYQQQMQQGHHSVPTTPEGPLPGTSGPPRSAHHLPTAFPPFQFPPPTLHTNPVKFRGGRGRSSSMFSEVSGFTDDIEDAAPVSAGPHAARPDWSAIPDFRPSSAFFSGGPYGFWAMPNGINGMRKGSGGSGSASASVSASTSASGSGSANGSQGDPLSPLQASAVTVTSGMNFSSLTVGSPWNPTSR